jgi:site-specific recombinase XerD
MPGRAGDAGCRLEREELAMAETPSAVVLYDPKAADPAATAVLGFLGGHHGRTREAYELDLRQWARWCQHRGLALFEVRRVDIERFARDLEQSGRAAATISRRLATVAGLYRFAEEEGLIEHSPAVHVRRPRVLAESHAVALDHNELGAFLVAAGLSSAQDHALALLLALNGLRISEALGADVSDLGLQRGHRTLFVHRKGNKLATVPLAPRTARAIDLAVDDRQAGPIFYGPDGQRLDRHRAARIIARLGRRAGLPKPISPHTLRHAFITAALDAGVSLRDVQEAASHADPRTTMRYDRGRQSLDRHPTYIVATFVAGADRT